MPTFDPSDLIGRTFLLPPEENGEKHRAKVTRQVVEIIDQDNSKRVENINYILDIGNGKVEELISYNQLLEHLERETGEITFEPLSIIAADDPVTCAAYAKENDLLL